MNPRLEIIIPADNRDASLAETVASLAAQTDREFNVLLAGKHSCALDAAQKYLTDAGIFVRSVHPPGELYRIEHWNWAHAQSQAEWLKPLSPGEQLKPLFVEQLKERIRQRPQARMIRCDMELRTEWGTETLTAPFEFASITAGEFINCFPAHLDWVSHSCNLAYNRTAWLAMGGHSPHVPGSAALNLNVMLALHYGLENLRETLVSVECPGNEKTHERISRSFELWLILLQARNYCLAAKLPWPTRYLFLRSLLATLRSR